MEEKYKSLKLAERGARISMVTYVALSILKLGIGHISGSKALTADGLNNTTDIIATFGVIIGLRISRKPADENHPYGHFRAETVSSLISSIIMVAVGVDVLYSAAYSVIFYKAEAPDLLAAAVALLSAAVIYGVYRLNKKTAVKINSSGLMASAKDNLSDAWVGVGTTAGIVASQFGLPWIDPLAAVVVGILILRTGFGIFKEAVHNLTDGFRREELDDITQSIKKVPRVKKVKEIRARVHGNNILMDVIVEVSSDLTVVEGHSVTVDIEEKLRSDFNITEVIVHVEHDESK